MAVDLELERVQLSPDGTKHDLVLGILSLDLLESALKLADSVYPRVSQ